MTVGNMFSLIYISMNSVRSLIMTSLTISRYKGAQSQDFLLLIYSFCIHCWRGLYSTQYTGSYSVQYKD